MVNPNVLTLVTLPVPPADLNTLPIWLCWSLEDGERPDSKQRKVPYYTSGRRRSGKQGSPEDLAELSSFDHALKAATRLKMSGVGIALLPGFNLTAVDFDDVVDQHGTVRPDVLQYLAGTYAELSPSQRGIRAFFRGSVRSIKSFAGNGDWPFSVEVFGDSGYTTFTGNTLDTCVMLGDEDNVAPWEGSAMQQLYMERLVGNTPSIAGLREIRAEQDNPLMTYEPRLNLTADQIMSTLLKLDPDMPEPEWAKVGWALHHETAGSEEGRELWHAWSSKGGKYDAAAAESRWQRAGNQRGTPITFRSVLKMAGAQSTSAPAAPNLEAVKRKVQRFAVIPAGDFVQRPSPSWIVKGILPRAALTMIYGESGSGKSFVALELATAIARGVKWRDRTVKQGRVIYVCAEGAGGFRNRLVAYCQDNNLAPSSIEKLGVIPAAPNLLSIEDAAALIESIKLLGPADVVILDTLAQVALGANENAGEDMGRVLGHCADIHRQTGASVVLIHHAGKDLAKGARGWSGIKAACDAEIEVNRLDDQRWLRISKMKDGEDGLELGFKLMKVVLGVDADGDEVSSCVVRDAGLVNRVSARGRWQELVFDVASEYCGLTGEMVPRDRVLDEVAKRAAEDVAGVPKAKEYARRAMTELIKKELLGEKNTLIGVI